MRYFRLAVMLAVAACATVAVAGTITLTGTARDFLYNGTPAGTYGGYAGVGHPDFQNACCGDDHNITTSALGLDGKPVYDGVGSWSTHGAAAFNEWYNDTPGVNVAVSVPITLSDAGHPGTYTYSNEYFFPIDGQGFDSAHATESVGDDGQLHNFSFTYEIDTTFGYRAGTGQVFTFTGDDDVFVYINGMKVIDLGGVHGAESESVNLDTLGLTDGKNYSLDVFYAERHTTGSHFRIDTTIDNLSSVPEPASFALLSSGLAGIFLRRKKK